MRRTRLYRRLCCSVAFAGVLAASPALAQNDFARSGCWVGLGIANVFEHPDIDQGIPGLQARAGCRGEWAGAEAHYEALEDFKDVWTLTLDGKVYPLAQVNTRFQPFPFFGFGYANLGDEATSNWDFAIRAGAGLDVYVTRNVVLNLNSSYVLPTKEENSDAAYVTLGWGVIYRF